jgi:hypothetical protein
MRELLMEEIDSVSGGSTGDIIGMIGTVVVGVAVAEFAAGFVAGAGWGAGVGPIGAIGVGVFAGLVGMGMTLLWDHC